MVASNFSFVLKFSSRRSKKLTMIVKTLCVLLILAASTSAGPCEGPHLHFVNDYSGCSRYFSCVDNYPHPLECHDGRYFQPNPAACVPAGSIECARCPAQGVVSFAVPLSCTKYTLCINGNSFDRECSAGTRFDWRVGRCALQETVQCDYLRCPDEGTLVVADPTSCRHYLVCVEGQEVARRECADNLKFDRDLGSCSRSENVVCGIRP